MTEFNRLSELLLSNYTEYMHLKIFIDSDDVELRNKYVEAINNRNLNILNNTNHIDAGFDLFIPQEQTMTSSSINKLDYNIICSARIIKTSHLYGLNTGFYMYPRSSISKSKIRLANNVGIIDAGYRGHLIGMFDVIYDNEVIINKLDRHLQICAPGLIPIIVEIVETREGLGEETIRGDGGFGSTGN
jgi:dUTP pyrophosphatase